MSPVAQAHTRKLKTRLTFARLREAALVTIVVLEAAYLVGHSFGAF